MTMAKRVWETTAGVVGVGLVLTMTAAVSGAHAQPPPEIKRTPYQPIVSVEGKDNFMASCAVCHGAGGKRDGPAAPALKGPIPDLTTIAQRRGKFDSISIERAISGADKMPAAHGSVDMPIWGHVFRGGTPDTATARMRLQNLAAYLKSIQAS